LLFSMRSSVVKSTARRLDSYCIRTQFNTYYRTLRHLVRDRWCHQPDKSILILSCISGSPSGIPSSSFQT
jgi:hypothetical protein